jgi:predicted transcriptional regulator YdeE
MYKNIEPFTIAGLSVRTTNQNGQAQQDIGNLWANFFSHNIAAVISGKRSGELICAYTEYESDMNGTYTTILGFKVADDAKQTNKVRSYKIPAASYRVFISPDARPETVAQTWMQIWQSEIPRAYQTDYDIYQEDGTVATWLSVKNVSGQEQKQ